MRKNAALTHRKIRPVEPQTSRATHALAKQKVFKHLKNTGIAIIDSDKTIKELNYKCAKLFNSYYEFDSHNQPCWFNYEKEKADKEIMLDLISKLVARLNELNDGSYIVEDLEIPRLKQL